MTENKAIEWLRAISATQSSSSHSASLQDRKEALYMAIQALEAIQAYRAIGTVEGYKRALEISKENFRVSMEYKAKVQEFEAIGTIEEFKALKEKSVAKKPSFEGDGYYNGQLVYDTWICPCCDKRYEVDYEEYEHCPSCGQKIDWGDEE